MLNLTLAEFAQRRRSSSVGAARMASSSAVVPRKRRRSSTALAHLEDGLEYMKEAQRKIDLEFIIKSLKGPKKEMTSDIATLLRSRADANGLGPRVTLRKTLKFGSLPKLLCKKGLDLWCGENDDQLEVISHMGHDDMLDTWCIALNVGRDTVFDFKHPALYFEGPFLDLSLQRYVDMGRRLKDAKLDRTNWGLFYIAEETLHCRFPKLSYKHPGLSMASDWVISDNWSHAAKCTSASMDSQFVCINKFKENFADDIVNERTCWFDVMASAKVPRSCFAVVKGISGKTKKSGQKHAVHDDDEDEDEDDLEDDFADEGIPSGDGRAGVRT